MANILITNYCERNCTFCFARSRIGQSTSAETSNNMSLENIRKIMDVLAKSGEKSLRLLGGEPSLHPQFKDIVQEALDRKFHVHLFTNAMMPKDVVDFLATIPSERLSLLCNVSPQAKVSPEKQEAVKYTLTHLGQNACVGITVTSPDFTYDFLLDYIERYKLRRRIRIGIAQPIVGEENVYLHPSEYRETGKSIVKMAQDCIEHEVLIGFDCGLTLCMFSEEEIGILAKCSEGLKIVCQPIIDIGPNMDVWHCFPLSEVLNTSLDKFDSHSEIREFYEHKVRPYRTFGCMEECLTCKHLKRGQCSGGCIAHSMKQLNKLPPKVIQS